MVQFPLAGVLAPQMMQQAPQAPTRQGLLGAARSRIGGLLGNVRDAAERGSPDMSWGERAMILGGGLRQIGGVEGALGQAAGYVDQRSQQRMAEQAARQQQEQLAAFRATLPPEQQALFDINPDQFTRQMAQAEFRAPPQDPNAVREYEFARQQGFPGSFMEFMESRRMPAAQVNVNLPEQPQIGAIPAGWEAVRDPQSGAWSMRPVAGGPVERDAAQEAAQAAARQEQTARAGGTVIQDINRALEILDQSQEQGIWSGPSAGPFSGQFRNVPGTPAFVMRQLIESALSNVGLDTLQRMRENSPTGGALGQVPIQQQRRLEQVLGSLDVTQPPDVVRDNLRRVSNIYMDIVYGTPEQLRAMRDAGDITSDQFRQYSARAQLSFDEMGRRIRQERGDQHTQDNPARPSTAQDVEVLPDGAFFINPADGQIYQRRRR